MRRNRRVFKGPEPQTTVAAGVDKKRGSGTLQEKQRTVGKKQTFLKNYMKKAVRLKKREEILNVKKQNI